MSHPVTDPRTAPRPPWPEIVGLGVYGALLLVFRPLDPFEWDEVLFQRALDHYDVASHSPHPPGYPLYVGLGRAVRLLVGDPQLALQLVGIAAALAALTLTWLLARRLGASRRAAALAAGVLAVVPGFVFNANIGMSDVPGVAAAAGAALLFTLAWERPGMLAIAALAAGVASGIRVASLIPALPFAAVAAATAWRRRSWRWLALAPVAFGAGAAAVWTPAILVTGPARFFGAVQQQSAYISRAWVDLRLPGADLNRAFQAWCLTWLGSDGGATVLWLLVATGAVAWWRASRRPLAVLPAIGAAAFLVFTAFGLELDLAMRYALPAAPFLALLAAGVTELRRPRLRLAAEALLLLWIAAAVAWVAPALPVRRRPAPVWQALQFVARTFDPASTKVLAEGVMGPHVRYVLGGAGFDPDVWSREHLSDAIEDAPAGAILVTPERVEGAEVLFEASWDSPRLMRLARNRYGSCVVSRVPRPPVRPELSPSIDVSAGAWRLTGSATVTLPAGVPPTALIFECRSGSIRLQSPGKPPAVLRSGVPTAVTVFPGRRGAVELVVTAGAGAVMEPARVLDVAPGGGAPGLAAVLVIPQVAHSDGASGSRWRTDVTLFNPGEAAASAELIVLPTGVANREAPAATVELAPGEVATLADVLAMKPFSGTARVGALVVVGTTGAGAPRPAELVATSRTYNLRAPSAGAERDETLPAVPAAEGICVGGRAVFRDVTSDTGHRANLGLVALADAPVVVTATVRGPDQRRPNELKLELPPFGHLQERLPAGLSGGAVELTVASGPSGARVYAYLSQIDEDSGRPRHTLPAVEAPCPRGAPLPPLPRRAPGAAPAR